MIFKPFRFLSQKIIPMTFDDTLSYYEIICKLVNKINDMMDTINNLSEQDEQMLKYIIKTVNQYQDDLLNFINDYQNTLTNDVNNYLANETIYNNEWKTEIEKILDKFQHFMNTTIIDIDILPIYKPPLMEILDLQEIKVKFNIISGKYQVNDFLEFNGSQYCDAGIQPTDETRIICTAQPKEKIGFWYGSRYGNTPRKAHAFIPYTTTAYPMFDEFVGVVQAKIKLNEDNTIDISKNGAYLNDKLIKTYTPSKFTSEYNMYIGGLNQGGTIETRTYSGNIKKFIVIENSSIIANFIPVTETTTHKKGLYDTVNEKFIERVDIN